MLSYKPLSRSACTLTGLIVAAVVLSSCGYRPLYGQYSLAPQTKQHLAAIKINQIPNRVGQQMRTALKRRLAPTASQTKPVYGLSISLNETVSKLAVEESAFATRANFSLTATYHLTRLSDGMELTDGKIKSVSSYNVLDSDFATLTAENDARKDAVNDLAETIRTRMAAYFLGPGTQQPAQKTGYGYR